MLFNSYAFLLFFAPVCFGGLYWLGSRSSRLAAAWLALASLVFYACWNPWNLPILLGSIAFNYAAARLIDRVGEVGSRKRNLLLGLAIAVNLAALCYYKYAGFFASNISAISGVNIALGTIALPLGISFFTFTQIAYLVDTAKGQVRERDLVHYLLFVTYFPHLIAGPIIHHKDVMPQFAAPGAYRFNAANVTIGCLMFILGLFKKCFIADNVAVFARPLFHQAQQGLHPPLLDAWSGALAYAFQIYYDFSGYSDMAVGLSLMLNVRLPFNFDSPYQSTSIIEFWKRWHISLSTFLRDYLYIPLGGNRRGHARRYLNLMLTMLIGGLWHGAAWTFVAWGGLHGLYLMVNHAWRKLRPGPISPLARAAGWMITFIAVIVAWVFFRAESFASAASILAGMAGMHGVASPLSGHALLAWGWNAALLAAVTLLPNSQHVVERHFTTGNYLHSPAGAVWKAPSPAWALGMGMLAALALMNLLQPAEFLYFNF